MRGLSNRAGITSRRPRRRPVHQEKDDVGSIVSHVFPVSDGCHMHVHDGSCWIVIQRSLWMHDTVAKESTLQPIKKGTDLQAGLDPTTPNSRPSTNSRDTRLSFALHAYGPPIYTYMHRLHLYIFVVVMAGINTTTDMLIFACVLMRAALLALQGYN